MSISTLSIVNISIRETAEEEEDDPAVDEELLLLLLLEFGD